MDGTSALSAADHCTYADPVPTVASASPTASKRGNTATTGAGLLGATPVDLNSGGPAPTYPCLT